MSHARLPRDESTADGRRRADRDESGASKVVLMELATVGRPLSLDELEDRTLLSRTAVESSIDALREMGLCRERPGDGRRPTRYVADEPPATDGAVDADD